MGWPTGTGAAAGSTHSGRTPPCSRWGAPACSTHLGSVVIPRFLARSYRLHVSWARGRAALLDAPFRQPGASRRGEVCSMLHVARCMLHNAWCMWYAVCCMLHNVGCMLHNACKCMQHIACCMLHVASECRWRTNCRRRPTRPSPNSAPSLRRCAAYANVSLVSTAAEYSEYPLRLGIPSIRCGTALPLHAMATDPCCHEPVSARHRSGAGRGPAPACVSGLLLLRVA